MIEYISGKCKVRIQIITFIHFHHLLLFAKQKNKTKHWNRKRLSEKINKREHGGSKLLLVMIA
ncbi:hypothetical protein HYC85_014405 [Camellia sinensis]|uniref:Uncharacterized protein n=1 Tax=Camellia sinensis TaxID=4442 RepID=A0A7J7H9I2_CAMSI|nr:hypothetical protein HYC85_014405 [Camellia sinensis]